jgi:putative tryptophan/tyrosine transport system substrate-binding protein
MKRRQFIAGLGSAVAWPQQPTVPVIGYLRAARPGLRSVDTIVAAFRAGLAETGYVEGRNVALEFQWAEGQIDRLPALAANLVRRQVARDHCRWLRCRARCEVGNDDHSDRVCNRC